MAKKEWKPQALEENMYLFKHRGEEIAYKYIEKKGCKETILFFYGFGGNIKMLDMILPYLTSEYSVLIVDYPGHGYSPCAHDASIDSFIQLVLQLLKHLNMKEILLVGYSFGGIIALKFYKEYCENIKRVILLNTKPYFSNSVFNKILYKIIETMLKINCYFSITKIAIPTLKDKHFTKEHYHLSKIVSKYNDPISVVKNYRAMVYYNADKLLDLIKCPTLVICGKKDILVSVAEAKKITLIIRKSRLEILPFIGHLSIVTGPEIVASKIIAFK